MDAIAITWGNSQTTGILLVITTLKSLYVYRGTPYLPNRSFIVTLHVSYGYIFRPEKSGMNLDEKQYYLSQ